ncbi:MAG: DUF3501 family protein [Candidatus Poribacteria bacterium]
MELLTSDDLMTYEEYEVARPEYRRRMIGIKRDRVVGVGSNSTWHFECRDTMRYQLQEMIRCEVMTEDEPIQGELEAYNPLIPGKNEISVTLMFEYELREEREKYLPLLVDIDEHVFLQIGDSYPVPAVFDAGQITPHKVSSVQYMKFHLSDEQSEALCEEGTVLRAIVTHPHYQVQAVLGENVRRAIQGDPV